jgi:cytochrome c oxidase assembly protein subunit 15
VIEFGNRLLSFVVLAVAVAALVAAWRQRPRRPDLVFPAGLLVGGVVAQGVVGGVTVLTGLHPLVVAWHFLFSIVLIGVALVLHHRAGQPAGASRPVVHPQLRRLQHTLVAVVGVVVTLGTLVTATGPHAGDPGTPRLGLDPRLMSQFHADGVFLLLGLTVALIFALRATRAPQRVRRAAALLLGIALAQGLIGYVQYFTGLPEVLVGAHLLGACLVWIAAVQLWLVSTTRAAPVDAGAREATGAARV